LTAFSIVASDMSLQSEKAKGLKASTRSREAAKDKDGHGVPPRAGANIE
jgi:hypothetical protein